jgi:carbamoyl-phosphate synthase small subunit
VSHVCLNDGVVEGLECLDVPAFSVQYHPEAAAGPHDAAYLFDRFAALMGSLRSSRIDELPGSTRRGAPREHVDPGEGVGS